MTTLRLVPPSPPAPKQARSERIKAMPRSDGQLQCPRCGCRTWLDVNSGGVLRRGKIIASDKMHSKVCDNCYRKGIVQSVLPPELKRIE